MVKLPNKSGIYQIVHLSSGRMYIGSFQDMRKRQNNHISSLRRGNHHCCYLQNAWNKYVEDVCDDTLDIIFKNKYSKGYGQHKKIQQLDKDENILATFNSISHASRETGVKFDYISRVCNGRRKSSAGFRWRFI